MSLPIIQDSELTGVTKPAQYLGGERGSIVKQDSAVDLHFCLAFPDTYEVGMSHVGYQILYDLINKDERSWAERVYVPLPDMEELLRKRGAPLRSLESKRALGEFDIVGFSLQYELCMNGILGILDLGAIPLLSRDRGEEDPLVIGGGPVAYHPEPFADFFDAFLIGDGEELVPEFNEVIKDAKRKGLSRQQTLHRISNIQGVYVPSFFEPLYSQTGNFIGFKPLVEGYNHINRRVLPSLEEAPFPESPLVPNIEVVHDRLSVEVMRGCVRGCRFCQAGYLYRPQRERKPEQIREIVRKSLKSAGHEELSLLSLSTADYCSILPLLSVLKEEFASKDELAISFPSTRVDALTPELLSEVQPIRRSGFTMAPEAGTQRLRDVINKGVTDEQITETIKNVFQLGWTSVKLYFMIGLPTETDEDLDGIIEIARRVKKIAGKRKQITISVSTHVPKPHTPFQWAEQITQGETVRRQQYLYRALKRIGVNFRYHDAESSFLEGVFARGDRSLGKVILRAYELGCRLDGWVEELQSDVWLQAFEEIGIDPHHYLHSREEEEALPWDHISCDIPKKYFLKEWKKASAARTTPDCLKTSCSICGACDYDAVRNVLFDRKRSESRLNIVDPPWQKIIDQKENVRREDSCEEVEVSVDTTTPSPLPVENGTYSLKEYLRTEETSRAQPPSRPVIPVAARLRLRYAKRDRMRFTAHLQLASLFFRAARRAGLPIAYSRGFHPKPKFAFGPPLQLGIESEWEFVDIDLTEDISPSSLVHRLKEELPEGLVALDAVAISLGKNSSIQASVSAQRYIAYLEDELVSEEERAKLEHVLEGWRERKVIRKRKGKAKEIALSDCVRKLSFDGKKLEFSVLSFPSGPSVKPFELLETCTGLNMAQFRVKKIETRFNNDKFQAFSPASAVSLEVRNAL